MNKLILLSFLLTVVYSWEDIKRFLRMAAYRLAKKKYSPLVYISAINETVSIFVILASIPIALASAVAGSTELISTLWSMVSLLLGLAGINLILKQIEKKRANEEMMIVYSIASLVAPKVRLIGGLVNLEKTLAIKLAALLSLPGLFALGLKYSVNASVADERVLASLDMLIRILFIALMILVSLEFLEKFSQSHRFYKLSMFIRILAGITISAVLIQRL